VFDAARCDSGCEFSSNALLRSSHVSVASAASLQVKLLVCDWLPFVARLRLAATCKSIRNCLYLEGHAWGKIVLYTYPKKTLAEGTKVADFEARAGPFAAAIARLPDHGRCIR
jgi:hypothetical protein